MPDGDLVERGLRRGWRRPYRLLKVAAAPEEVAGAVLQAASAMLREHRGIPELYAVAEVIIGYAGARDRGDAMHRLNDLRLGSGVLQAVLDAAARRYVAALEVGRAEVPPDLVEAKRRLAVVFVEGLIDSQLLERLRPDLVYAEWSDHRRYDGFVDSVKSSIASRIGELADQLVQAPTAEDIRAPSVGPRERMTSIEMLNMSLVN